MKREQLKALIENLVSLSGETETVEFKENNYNKEEIGKRIAGLSNSANLKDKKFAYLVFGVKDKTHKIVGTVFNPKKEKVGAMELENWLQQHLSPKIDFSIH